MGVCSTKKRKENTNNKNKSSGSDASSTMCNINLYLFIMIYHFCKFCNLKCVDFASYEIGPRATCSVVFSFLFLFSSLVSLLLFAYFFGLGTQTKASGAAGKQHTHSHTPKLVSVNIFALKKHKYLHWPRARRQRKPIEKALSDIIRYIVRGDKPEGKRLSHVESICKCRRN